jgi:hypothetical protein
MYLYHTFTQISKSLYVLDGFDYDKNLFHTILDFQCHTGAVSVWLSNCMYWCKCIPGGRLCESCLLFFIYTAPNSWMLCSYKNFETTRACVSSQQASAIDIILSIVSSKFWLKYQCSCKEGHNSLYASKHTRGSGTMLLIRWYDHILFILLLTYGFLWIKKAAFVKNNECSTFFLTLLLSTQFPGYQFWWQILSSSLNSILVFVLSYLSLIWE